MIQLYFNVIMYESESMYIMHEQTVNKAPLLLTASYKVTGSKELQQKKMYLVIRSRILHIC